MRAWVALRTAIKSCPVAEENVVDVRSPPAISWRVPQCAPSGMHATRRTDIDTPPHPETSTQTLPPGLRIHLYPRIGNDLPFTPSSIASQNSQRTG